MEWNEKSRLIPASNGKRADVLFVVDASDSMRPCFDQLRDNIKKFVEPFKEEGFESLRLGLLAYNAGPKNGKWVYRHTFINGDAPENMQILYGDDDDAQEKLFTESGDGFVDVDAFCDRLDKIKCCADENTPLALDCAADFPFEPMAISRRIIVLFTDERLEDGVLKKDALGDNCSNIKKIMEKITKRHIKLYYFGPDCDGVAVLSEYTGVITRSVKAYQERDENEDVWGVIDFEKILQTMGAQISKSALQIVDEGDFSKAVYGQDRWDLETWGKKGSDGVIDITDVKEGAELDVSEPLEWINAKMRWETPIDLDIHAFYKMTNGSKNHIWFSQKVTNEGSLDNDAGIGDKVDNPKGNEENIKFPSLNGIERILIATKIYSQHGCFSDYRAQVEVSTSNPNQEKIVVRMKSDERLDWCVIAMIDNSDPDKPRVFPVNRVVAYDPDLNDPSWENQNN